MQAIRVAAWGLLGLAPFAAVLAGEVQRTLEPGSGRFWFALFAVQVLVAIGHAASSLPDWARWKDTSGGEVAVAERRLKLLQGLVLAALAGNIAYFGGHHYYSLPEIPSFIAAALAAYGGDKFLSPLLSRLTGKAAAP